LLSALLLFLLLLRDLGRKKKAVALPAPLPQRRLVLRSLLCVALPVTLGASVLSLVTLLDTALISARLQAAGIPPEVANAMYSSYGNLAVPLYNLVPALLAPVTLSLTPLLCGAFVRKEQGEMQATLSVAWRLVLLVGIPASLGLCLFSKPLLSLIYAGQEEAIGVAAPLLSVLALAVLPSCMMALMGTCCQATGHVMLPVAAMGAGGVVKLLCEYFLLTVPRVWLLAAPISTLFCTLTVLLIEGIGLSRILSFPILGIGDLFRPLLAGGAGMAAGVLAYVLLHRALGEPRFLMLPVAAVAALVTLFLAPLCGALQTKDLQAMPGGERAAALLQKIKLLK
jgi:stage V sporulation protein B